MNQLVDIMKNVAHDLNLGKCEIIVNDATQKGDGYLSSIWSSRVTNVIIEMNFIIKKAIHMSNPEEQKDVAVAFQNEIRIYKDILPAFEQLQEENNVKHAFNCYPKCYATSLRPGDEALVLDNLKISGYGLWDRFTPLNEDHTVAVLKEYGRLHALSYALRDQKPQAFQRITEGFQDLIGNIVETRWKPFFSKTLDVVGDLLKSEGNIVAAEKIASVKSEIVQIATCASSKDPHSVILHGDCWSNNIMFKYEGTETTKPKSIRFLDWQISRVGSPVLDVSYFLYICCPKSVLDGLNTYLSIYYDSLSSFMKELGSNPQTVFSFEDFMEHWSKYRKYGLLWSLWVLKFALADTEELSDSADERLQQIVNNCQKGGEYFNRARNIVEHFVNNNFI